MTYNELQEKMVSEVFIFVHNEDKITRSELCKNLENLVREQIAKEIEAKCCCSWECTCGAIDMAFVARGQK